MPEHVPLCVRGQEATVFTRSPKTGKVAVVAAVGQARDPVAWSQRILEVTQLARNAKVWTDIPQHVGGKFAMKGRGTCPSHNRRAWGWYAAQCRKAVEAGSYAPNHVEAAIEEVCNLVWAEALAKWPWLAKYREQFFSKLGRSLLYGDSATTLVSKTEDCAVELHLDTDDGPYSLIVWVHRGDAAAKIIGGNFDMINAGMTVVATNGTIALVAAGATVHGTRPLRVVAVEEGGHVAPGVRRLGFSHFVKRSYLASFAALAAGAGGVEALWRTMLGHARAYYAETSAERRAAMLVEDKAAIAELAARGAGQSPFSKPAARRYAGSILRAGLVWQPV